MKTIEAIHLIPKSSRHERPERQLTAIFNQKIGALITTARKRAGISQRQLSADAGIYSTALQQIERGEQRCSLLQFVAVANALDINPGDWLNSAVFRTYLEAQGALIEDASAPFNERKITA